MSHARRWTGTVAVVLAALLAAPVLLVESDATAPAYRSLPAFGTQFHGMWDDYSDAERARVLDQLADNGVEWIRLDLSWAMLQPESGESYSPWGVAFSDRVVGMAHERGLKILVMFWLTPAWANADGGTRSGPSNPEDYARAARWVADRYAEEVSAWEIWNEPNDADFWVGADPAEYTELLRAAYPSIKEADPEATVVFGGTSYNDDAWIEKAYEAGAAGYFDAMATHPYQAVADLEPEAPDDGTPWRLSHLSAVRNVMVRYGDGDKPIWATEFGWSSHGNTGPRLENWQRGVTLEQQADYLVRAVGVVSRRHPYVTHMFWYRERDVASGDPQQDHYGLLTRELKPKPVLQRLGSLLAEGAA